MFMLYVAAWMMSGSFLAGILSVAFFVFNRFESSLYVRIIFGDF